MLRIVVVREWGIVYIFYDDRDREKGCEVWRRLTDCYKRGKWEYKPVAFNISHVAWAKDKMWSVLDYCAKNQDACFELTPELCTC